MSSACFQHEIKTFNYKINNLLKQIKTIFILFNKYLCGRHSHMSSEAGTCYPSGTPEFTPGFSGFRGTRSSVCMLIDRCVSFCPFVLFHDVIALFVPQFTDSDYPFGILKLFLHLLMLSPIVKIQ